MTDDVYFGKLLNGRGVGRYLGVPRDHGYDLIARGELGPIIRIGRARFVSRENVDRWVKEQTELDGEEAQVLPLPAERPLRSVPPPRRARRRERASSEDADAD